MMIYHDEELQLLDEASGETGTNIQLFDSNFVISLLLLKLAFVGGETTMKWISSFYKILIS